MFEIIEIGPSMRQGSASAMLGAGIARSLTANKHTNALLRIIAMLLLYPFRGIRTADQGKTAGGFYLIFDKVVFLGYHEAVAIDTASIPWLTSSRPFWCTL